VTFTILSPTPTRYVSYRLATAMSRLPTASLSAFALALVLSPVVARAEDAAVTPARQLFLDARKLTAEGKYAEACPKLEESLHLESGVGTQFNLADCWEHIGRTASAQALFLGAAASAKAAGQTEREQVLRDRASALEPRLSRLVIEVVSTDPKLTVKRDDLPLEADTLGKAVVVDPGKYTISARAPGKKKWEKIVEVDAAKPVTTVEVPELEPAEPAKPVAEKPAAAPLKKAPPPASEPGSDRGPALNYRALTLAGAGVIGIGFGVYKGLKYRSTNGDAEDICPSSHGCTIKQIQNHDRLVDIARTDRTWSYVGFGVGGAVLAGAGVLWFVERPKRTAGISWEAAPVVAVDGSVGALVNGRF
jgi:hypothetical protein